MDLTVYATWLNEVFGLFDTFFLGLHHELAVSHGDLLTPIANALGAAGHYGVMFIALSIVLLFFRKTRLAGASMLVGIAIAGGLSEFVIKGIVARPRPFEMSELFNSWWMFVGSPDAHGSSFPSGHVAAATAAMIALAYGARRWWVSLLGVILIVAMAIDRMYLIVHYPSDVLAGFVIGFFGGIIGYAIMQTVWRLLGKHPDQLAEAQATAARRADFDIPRGDSISYAAISQNQPMQPYSQQAYQQQAYQQQARQPQAYQQQVYQQGYQTAYRPGYRTQTASAQQGGSQAPAQTQAIPQVAAQPAPASARHAKHAVPQTLQTANGSTVVVPPVPVQQATPDATQVISQAGIDADASRPTAESGFQVVEEYYRGE